MLRSCGMRYRMALGLRVPKSAGATAHNASAAASNVRELWELRGRPGQCQPLTVPHASRTEAPTLGFFTPSLAPLHCAACCRTSHRAALEQSHACTRAEGAQQAGTAQRGSYGAAGRNEEAAAAQAARALAITRDISAHGGADARGRGRRGARRLGKLASLLWMTAGPPPPRRRRHACVARVHSNIIATRPVPTTAYLQGTLLLLKAREKTGVLGGDGS